MTRTETASTEMTLTCTLTGSETDVQESRPLPVDPIRTLSVSEYTRRGEGTETRREGTGRSSDDPPETSRQPVYKDMTNRHLKK